MTERHCERCYAPVSRMATLEATIRIQGRPVPVCGACSYELRLVLEDWLRRRAAA